MTLGALAFDKAVRQKHVFLRVKKLLNGAGFNQAGAFEVAVNLLGQLVVFRGIGAVPVVKTDVKTIQIRFTSGSNVGHKLLGRFAGFFGGNHDGRAVGVVGAAKIHRVAPHTLKTHPNIGLDVFHDVTNMKVAVGVGQGGGHKQLAGHVRSCRSVFRGEQRF